MNDDATPNDATPPDFSLTDTLDDDLPNRFFRQKGGIWFMPPQPRLPKRSGPNSEPPEPEWVCGDLEIEAETADETSDAHGLLLRWIDRAGVTHSWAMPKRLVHADGAVIAGALEDAGLPCNTSRWGHELLKRLFGAARSKRRVRCVDRAGWHDGDTYLMQDGRAFGLRADALVMQTEHIVKTGRYAARGSLPDWQDGVARFAPGNDLLTLSISAAFAAPLLDIMGEASGGIHLFGPSRSGKTTLLYAAASVWGPGDSSGPIRAWRATANGLEAVAAETCDGPLFLDEMGQAAPREVGDVVYLLSNESGKSRATRTGGPRRQKTWRVFYLSTGELTPEQKMAEADLQAHPGQGVRLVSLSADAGASFGVWQDLYGMASPALLSEALSDAARRCCGTAAPAFLAALAADRADDPAALAATLQGRRERFLAAVLPADASGQIRSVARRFATIAAAGELATAYGITGWPENTATAAADAIFQRWLAARGGLEAAEDMAAIEAPRAFIAAHGNARFETSQTKLNEETGKLEDTDIEAARVVVNRAGFRKRNDSGGSDYFILADVWRKEVCKGRDPVRIARVLADRGLLIRGSDGRLSQKDVSAPWGGRPRVYRVSGAILGDDTNVE